MRILLMLAHSIAEHDDLKMFHELGYDVFSIGAYTNPALPDDDKRPPLPDVPYHDDLARACARMRAKMGDPGNKIDWAKASLPSEVIDWADVIIVHHFVEHWLYAQWPRIKHKQVIWRTNGQSNPQLEQLMKPLRKEGLLIVRYAETERFMPNFAGRDALIRFGKDPAEWNFWHGSEEVVGNVTQNMVQRGDATGLQFWAATTNGLPVMPAGPGSELLRNGQGTLDYGPLREYLRMIRCYLYTGTLTAPYTLGLIEAMMTGVPVVSIGPEAWLPSLPDLFEAHQIVNNYANDPVNARMLLRNLLDDPKLAAKQGAKMRLRATEYFGIDTVKAHWRAFLG